MSVEKQKSTPSHVIGPLGERLTLDTLPPVGTIRWVVRRKAEVVAAVAGGLLSVEQACERYHLTIEELSSWRQAVDRSGLQGLKINRVEAFRRKSARAAKKTRR
jgi:hypothetical protein